MAELLTNPAITHSLTFILGLAVKTGFDYWRGDQLLQKEHEYRRQSEIEEWKTSLRRTIDPVLQQYSELDTEAKDQRNDMRNTVEKLVSSLLTHLNDAPATVDDEFIKQIQAFTDSADDLSGSEIAMGTVNLSGRGPPIEKRERSEEREKEAEEDFIDEIEQLIQELEEIQSCVDN